MRKVTAILLVFFMFGNALPLPELVKLPFLIHHYNEHKALHPSDSVFTFLYKHYILNQKPESQDDKNSDRQMPFKSAQTFHHYFCPFAFENKPEKVANNPVRRFYLPVKEMKTTNGFFSFWQPPKVG